MVTLAGQKANEIVVDGRGNIYINGADFNFSGGEAPKPGYIKLVTPDGELRQVADDIQFPNGMVITPDNRTLIISESFAGRLTAFDIDADGGLSGRRVFAEGLGPDGICLDAEGAVWVSAGGFSIVRVAEGGEVLQRVELRENRAPFALMLGGPDRRTLFIMTAEWRLADGVTGNLERLANGPRTGEILALPVSVPGAGRPLSLGPSRGPADLPELPSGVAVDVVQEAMGLLGEPEPFLVDLAALAVLLYQVQRPAGGDARPYVAGDVGVVTADQLGVGAHLDAQDREHDEVDAQAHQQDHMRLAGQDAGNPLQDPIDA
jgi:hypothetical protein